MMPCLATPPAAPSQRAVRYGRTAGADLIGRGRRAERLVDALGIGAAAAAGRPGPAVGPATATTRDGFHGVGGCVPVGNRSAGAADEENGCHFTTACAGRSGLGITRGGTCLSGTT
jgi:hypothetical protein